MSTSTKPATSPTSNKSDSKADTHAEKVNQARQEFFAAAFSMSWQLAVVVLVPIIGGFKLDEHFNSLPLWTLTGFILAMIGMAAVLWRQLQILSPTNPTKPYAKTKGKGGRK